MVLYAGNNENTFNKALRYLNIIYNTLRKFNSKILHILKR